jgi:hypothetical protein
MLNRKWGKILCLLEAAITLCLLLPGCEHQVLEQGIKAEVNMTAGDKVHLFYGGPQEAENMFCIDEVISVYRIEHEEYIEVGKVKIIRAIDKNNLEAQVVEGNVKEGDLVRKSIAACKIKPIMPRRP